MLRAEFSLAPLLFLAAFAVISSLSKKRQRGASGRPAAGGTPEPDLRPGFMTELRKAMEELQQVQNQTPQTPTGHLPGAPTPQEKLAAEWIAKQKARKALKPQGRVRSVRKVVPLADDDADKSSETGGSLEGRDYDDEAVRIIEARRQAAEHRVVRTDETSEGLSTLQQARRAARQDEAIGGTAEHAAWHGEIGKEATGQGGQGGQKGQRGLKKFADGTSRSAIILGEILRPPVGQRDA